MRKSVRHPTNAGQVAQRLMAQGATVMLRTSASPAIWFCLARRARRQTSVTARRATGRRTTVVVRDDVVDRRSLNMGGAMRGRSRRRDGGAENNSKGKGNFCVGEHCRISSRQLCGYTQEKTVDLVSYSRPFAVATPRGNFAASWRAGLGRRPLAVTHRRLQNGWIIPGGRWPARHFRQRLHEHVVQTAGNNLCWAPVLSLKGSFALKTVDDRCVGDGQG